MNVTVRKAAVAVLVSLTSAAAFAHGMRGDGRALADLNLSSAQKAQIEKIEQQYHPASQADDTARQAQYQQWQQKKQQLLKERVFNENSARQLIQQRQQQQTERELQHLRKQHAVFQVLNAEQQQKWLAKRDQTQSMAHKHKGGHPHHHPARPAPNAASAPAQ